jgi:hypothetical protein
LSQPRELLDVSLSVEKRELRELIKKVTRGEWRLYLPQFQREFEWDADDIRHFLDSIIRNLPVGSIILWKPAGRIEDPFAVPLADTVEAGPGGKSFYLLDGQQRLTSLLLLYNGWKLTRMGDEISKDVISYVPAQNKLIVGEKGGIDLSALFRGWLEGEFRRVVESYAPKYREALENVVRRIVEYEIPIYVVETLTEDSGVLGEMAEAFVRINKAGVRIGTVELMLSFLAGMVSGEFSKEVRRLHKGVKDFNLDLNVLVRFVLSNFGVKQTVFSNVEQFKSSVEKVRFDEDVLRRSEMSINLVRALLREELGLDDCRIVPSKVSLIPIAKYFYERQLASINELSDEDRRAIAGWFVVANMKGRYSASVNSRLQEDLEVVAKSPRVFPYDQLMDRMGERREIREADVEKGNGVNVLKRQGLQYLFLLYVLLMKEGAEDLDGKLLRAKRYSDLDKHHLFPREVLDRYDIPPDDPDEKEVFVSGLGNITFVDSKLHKRIPKEAPDAEPSHYLPNFPALLTHFIPTQKELWKPERFEEFKQERVKEIYKAAKRHFPQVVE